MVNRFELLLIFVSHCDRRVSLWRFRKKDGNYQRHLHSPFPLISAPFTLMSLDSLFLLLPLPSALSFMAARMKVDDQCCKSKAVLGYDLFRPKRTAVTIVASLFFSLPEEARDEGCFMG